MTGYQSTIDAIKNKADILEVAQGLLNMTRKGANYVCLSPFTEEKTPSFTVSQTKQIYKCFSTGKGGDVISFVQEVEHLTFNEAITYLGDKYGIPVVKGTPEEQKKYKTLQDLKESIFIVNEFAVKHYQETLKANKEAQAYLKERGINAESIKKFQLGAGTKDWDSLYKAAISAKYDVKILQKADLTRFSKGKNYDRFRNRIMFPIQDTFGKSIGFGARVFTEEDGAKYLNPQETPVYHKGDVLYGLFQAKAAIKQQQECFLVEGYTDVISMSQAGVENVVAASGTAISENQIKIIKRLSVNITLLFDGDKAGIKATLRSIELYLGMDVNLKVVTLPQGIDPNEFINKHGEVKFKKFIEENKTDVISFYILAFYDDVKDDSYKKGKLVERCAQLIGKVPNLYTREFYCKKCSELLEIKDTRLKKEVEKLFNYSLKRIGKSAVNTKNNEPNEAKKKRDSTLNFIGGKEFLEISRNAPPVEFLLYELIAKDEITICFAKTGVGKSIFASTVCLTLAEGLNILEAPFMPPKMKVMDLDFELSITQKRNRFLSEDKKTEFNFKTDNYVIVNENKEFMDYDKLEGSITDFYFEDLGKFIVKKKLQGAFLVIDNMTWMIDFKIEDALKMANFMKKLKIFKNKYQLTILVIAHTPKIIDYTPLDIIHMAGSYNISGFVDAIFAIGKSIKGSSLRYIKQLKFRNGDYTFDADNVLLVAIENYKNATVMRKVTTESEILQLESSENQKATIHREAHKLYTKDNLSYEKIGKILKVDKATACRWVKKEIEKDNESKLKQQELDEKMRTAREKIYQRIPILNSKNMNQ